MIPPAGMHDADEFRAVLFRDAEADAGNGEHFAGRTGSKTGQPGEGAVGEDAESWDAKPPSLGQPPRS